MGWRPGGIGRRDEQLWSGRVGGLGHTAATPEVPHFLHMSLSWTADKGNEAWYECVRTCSNLDRAGRSLLDPQPTLPGTFSKWQWAHTICACLCHGLRPYAHVRAS
jgi:hypothetical protein